MEKPSSYLKDNSIGTYLPLLFCLSKGCAVTSGSAETAELPLHNFWALIAAQKELELLPPIDKHQTQTCVRNPGTENSQNLEQAGPSTEMNTEFHSRPWKRIPDLETISRNVGSQFR